MAVPELLDDAVQQDWGSEPSEWDLLAIRAKLVRMLQLRRDKGVLDGLRKRIAETYTERLQAFDAEYDALRAEVADWITRFNDKEPVRLPDVGTAYLQGKDAQPRLVLASQEAAVTWVQALPKAKQDNYYTRAFSPQAYLQAQADTVTAIIAGAARDEAGRVKLTDDGSGVVQRTGEIVQLPPGLQLQLVEPVLALRQA